MTPVYKNVPTNSSNQNRGGPVHVQIKPKMNNTQIPRPINLKLNNEPGQTVEVDKSIKIVDQITPVINGKPTYTIINPRQFISLRK